jgi:hypothetical protein
LDRRQAGSGLVLAEGRTGNGKSEVRPGGSYLISIEGSSEQRSSDVGKDKTKQARDKGQCDGEQRMKEGRDDGVGVGFLAELDLRFLERKWCASRFPSGLVW